MAQVFSETHPKGPNPRKVSRIFVANLATSKVTAKELRDLFGRYGEITEEPFFQKNYGFVQFKHHQSAERARAETGRQLHGNTLEVKLALGREEKNQPRRRQRSRSRERLPLDNRDYGGYRDRGDGGWSDRDGGRSDRDRDRGGWRDEGRDRRIYDRRDAYDDRDRRLEERAPRGQYDRGDEWARPRSPPRSLRPPEMAICEVIALTMGERSYMEQLVALVRELGIAVDGFVLRGLSFEEASQRAIERGVRYVVSVDQKNADMRTMCLLLVHGAGPPIEVSDCSITDGLNQICRLHGIPAPGEVRGAPQAPVPATAQQQANTTALLLQALLAKEQQQASLGVAQDPVIQQLLAQALQQQNGVVLGGGPGVTHGHTGYRGGGAGLPDPQSRAIQDTRGRQDARSGDMAVRDTRGRQDMRDMRGGGGGGGGPQTLGTFASDVRSGYQGNQGQVMRNDPSRGGVQGPSGQSRVSAGQQLNPSPIVQLFQQHQVVPNMATVARGGPFARGGGGSLLPVPNMPASAAPMMPAMMANMLPNNMMANMVPIMMPNMMPNMAQPGRTFTRAPPRGGGRR